MKLRSSFIISCLVLFINASPLFAQWVRTNGPCGTGGEIFTICIRGSSIFAGTDKGVYVSKDNGKSWLNINPAVPPGGPYPVSCFALAVEGQNLFASMGANGLYVSLNDGETWTTAGNGIPASLSVMKMAVSGTKVIASTPYLYQTTDDGLSWSMIDSSRIYIMSLLAQDSFVFAGAYGGILRSSDYGTTWSQVYSTSVAPVWAIAKSGDRVFAGVGNWLISSIDGGATWNGDSSALNCTIIRSIVTSPAESGSNYVFAGTDSGVYRSSDNGASWTSKTPGFNSQLILTLLFYKDQESGNFVLLAGTGAGIYSSTDYGNTWFATGIPPGTWYLTAIGSNLFAGSTSMPYVTLGAGSGVTNGRDNRCEVYRSSDFGLSWREVDQGLIDEPNSVLTSLASSPYVSNGFSLFAGATSSYRAGYGPVFASSDLGATWVSVIPDSLGGEYPTVFAGSSSMFVGTTRSGMFRSTDHGLTWTAHDSGMTMPPWDIYGHSCVNAFSIDGAKLYAGGGYGLVMRGVGTYNNFIVVSTDDGVTWSPVDSGFSKHSRAATPQDTVSVLKCIYASGTHLLIGTQAWDYGMTLGSDVFIHPAGGGIYHIVTNGSGWTLLDSALMGLQVSSIVSKAGYIFASATGSGVFHSHDNGTTWTNISDGLTDGSVTSLFVLDPYLFAATTSGVYRRPLSEITAVGPETISTKVPEKYSLGQNYPNPFNPATRIEYSLPRTSRISLTLYNILGQQVASLFEGVRPSGTYSAVLDGSHLATGVYFYRLQTDAFVDIKKLVLLK